MASLRHNELINTLDKRLTGSLLQMIFSKTFLMNIMASHTTSNPNIHQFVQSDMKESAKTRISGPLYRESTGEMPS